MLKFSSFSKLLPMAVAVLAGAAVPFQAASNAALGRALGHPLWATLTSLAVSVLVVLPLMLLMRVPAPALAIAARGPAWWWLGGVAGVLYITVALIMTPKLGAASFIASVVAGQMLASLLIDHYGLMGMAAKPASVLRVAGVALIVLGMIVVQMNSKPAASMLRGASSAERL
ncbi:DMT family transporter [Pseudoduganella violacea]|uniref:Transporter family-2 protein n=1 Tax=Pseudoduganella violacea TaxID=1715466 RepID=A0A7W5FWF3_9BURK|nr:DMT family transporter [Pseudoduganella violacea]MBB3121776.1 transporter family-2 protein [Pseudoduganella violacea]